MISYIFWCVYSTVKQVVYSRSPVFDGTYMILTVDDVVKSGAPQTPGLWLNIQVNGL